MINASDPYILMKAMDDGKAVPKKPYEFDWDDFKKMEKNVGAKKLQYFGLN